MGSAATAWPSNKEIVGAINQADGFSVSALPSLGCRPSMLTANSYVGSPRKLCMI